MINGTQTGSQSARVGCARIRSGRSGLCPKARPCTKLREEQYQGAQRQFHMRDLHFKTHVKLTRAGRKYHLSCSLKTQKIFKKSLCFGFVSLTASRTEFHCIPHSLPLFPPRKCSSTSQAPFFLKRSFMRSIFLMHIHLGIIWIPWALEPNEGPLLLEF